MMILSKDLNIRFNTWKYQGEQYGPKFSKNKVNVKMLDSDSSVLIIYTKNENFIAKVIQNDKIENYDKIEFGNYHIYEFI